MTIRYEMIDQLFHLSLEQKHIRRDGGRLSVFLDHVRMQGGGGEREQRGAHVRWGKRLLEQVIRERSEGLVGVLILDRDGHGLLSSVGVITTRTVVVWLRQST